MPSEITARLRAPFQKLMGVPQGRFSPLGWDNNFTQRAMTANRQNQIDLIGTDASDRLLLGGAYQNPLGYPVQYAVQANSKISTAPIFTNANDSDPLEVTRIDCVFDVTNGAALTGYISKEVNGQAPGAGTSCMSGTFNLNATARTVQNATLAGPRGYSSLVLNAGEQLSLKLSTAVTSLAGLVITVWLRPFASLPPATIGLAANADIATQTIYLNFLPGQTIRAVSMRWSVAGSDAGAVTADITKDTGTNAPGAGTSILSAAQSVKGTANTTVFPALSGTASVLQMGIGDRLALKMTGTLTDLAGLVVTVHFSNTTQDYLVIPLPCWDAVATDRTVFLADRYYQILGALAIWSTASSSGTITFKVDRGTGAIASGTAVLTATISTAGTANTANEGSPVVATPSVMQVAPGDRVSLDHGGTTTSLAGMFVALVLLKR